MAYTSPVQTEMTQNQASVSEQLTRWGFEWIWANGKGGGFWVKGQGYMSLEDCAKLINQSIRKMVSDEKDRLGEVMIKAMAEAKAALNSNYFEKATAVYEDARAMLEALDDLPLPIFYLAPEMRPAPGRAADEQPESPDHK